MWRAVVTVWYVLAALLAPKLCCCLTHLTAPKGVVAAGGPAEIGSGACPHCSKESRRGAPAKGGQHEPPDPKCPCKHAAAKYLTVAVPSATAAEHGGGPAGSPADGPARPAAAPAVGSHPGGLSPRCGPFLTTDDLLRAFHFLRC